MKTRITPITVSSWFLIATAMLVLAGCSHNRTNAATVPGGIPANGTAAQQQQAIEQSLATRTAYLKAHSMLGRPQ